MGIVQPTYFSCRIVAVHHRHLDVHKDQLIRSVRSFFQHIHTFHTIFCAVYRTAFFLQQLGGDLRIEVVVLGQQDPCAAQAFLIRRVCFSFRLCFILGRNAAGNGHSKRGANTDPALHFHGAAHQPDQLFHDTHPDAAALHLADGGRTFPFKRFKNVLLKLLRHPDAVIGNRDHRIAPALFFAGLLRNIAADRAAGSRVFDSVADEVCTDLGQVRNIRIDIRILQLCCHRKHLPLAVCLIPEHGNAITEILLDIRNRILHLRLIVLDSGKIQNIVQQHQQVLSAHLNVLHVIFQLCRVVQMPGGKVCVTDNGVHGRADIMGHIEQEGGFGVVRALGVFHSDLQFCIQFLRIACGFSCSSFGFTRLPQQLQDREQNGCNRNAADQQSHKEVILYKIAQGNLPRGALIHRKRAGKHINRHCLDRFVQDGQQVAVSAIDRETRFGRIWQQNAVKPMILAVFLLAADPCDKTVCLSVLDQFYRILLCIAVHDFPLRIIKRNVPC